MTKEEGRPACLASGNVQVGRPRCDAILTWRLERTTAAAAAAVATLTPEAQDESFPHQPAFVNVDEA